jgi:hypothetical protein
VLRRPARSEAYAGAVRARPCPRDLRTSFDSPHLCPPDRKSMAASLSKRVRGGKSVQARLAPITGWQSIPMLPLTQVSQHDPAHSAGVLNGWARGVWAHSVAAPPAVLNDWGAAAHPACAALPSSGHRGASSVRRPPALLLTRRRPAASQLVELACFPGRAPRGFRGSAVPRPRAVRLTVEASSLLAPPPLIHTPRGWLAAGRGVGQPCRESLSRRAGPTPY